MQLDFIATAIFKALLCQPSQLEEGEGNIYITKATAGVNLTVKLFLKPKEQVSRASKFFREFFKAK